MNYKNIDFRKLENALIKLYGKIEIIEELQKHRGDKFNIFSILKMERLEVKTHSSFLYELINPKGTHYQDDKYLRVFVYEVLKIEDFDFVNVKVGRETLIDANRRIDFTIENDDYYVAIEMKIDATDQDKQLSDYFEYAKKQNKKFPEIYYLTLDGRNSDEKSAKEIKYERISFQSNILNFIEKSIEKSANLPIIRESLIQYRNLILNITNQTTQEIQMEIIEIIDTPKMAEAATKMSKGLAYAWAKREVLFWEKLEKKLNEYSKSYNLDTKGWIVSFYDEDIKDNKLNYIINAKIKNMYFNKDDYYFKICSYFNDDFGYQMEFDDSSKDINILAQKIGFKPTTKSRNYSWINSNLKLNFCKDYEEPTYDIFDNNKLDEIVENIFNEIKSYMDIIVKELN
ncbi:PD-(D/E)XK nuclease family protein [Arcobacter defluvii]|uniref:PD-(D/E)XK nuclease family protein n=1 Tax=Arcobacter defluvii TaxID=873191 RepID=A0AAE7BDV2_9BACT|nr:PD-(D/E)XK nuclease family protein [Arcobacter defluvii]QKF77625.1 hypothetical protein ADFLV_1604 [Arcobacter defluvii]RXI34400.1 hypothetical protein CP964_03325 [Arcobacter defluvii]